jgi:hypothetical protein
MRGLIGRAMLTEGVMGAIIRTEAFGKRARQARTRMAGSSAAPTRSASLTNRRAHAERLAERGHIGACSRPPHSRTT